MTSSRKTKKSARQPHSGGHKLTNPEANEVVAGIIRVYKTRPTAYTMGPGLDPTRDIQSVTFDNTAGFHKLYIHNRPMRKLHPFPAIVFVVGGRYMHVPDYLFGPLKYASETINIEQLFIDPATNLHYQKTGEKRHALLTGSCASLTITAITVKFAEDMIAKYRDPAYFYAQDFRTVCREFRAEYDRRVGDYLCGHGIVPAIPWFDNRLEREYIQGPWTPKDRIAQGCPADPNYPGTVKADKMSTL